MGFQSTRPVWGATLAHGTRLCLILISIHAPRVGRDHVEHMRQINLGISIHAPRVGRDQALTTARRICKTFQSTRPVWGATEKTGVHRQDISISIHAPRVGRDGKHPVKPPSQAWNFNPRAPCGARQSFPEWEKQPSAFQSTRPVWGATYDCFWGKVGYKFQSTRPVWGATSGLRNTTKPEQNFNPRAPCGARP